MTEQQLAEAFVEMADTLVDDFDLMDFLHLLTDRCVRLLDVSAAGPSAAPDRWPRFVAEARQAGFAAMHALPMRLRTDVIGALNLFSTQPGGLGEHTVRLGQALADIATIGLMQARAISRRDTL